MCWRSRYRSPGENCKSMSCRIVGTNFLTVFRRMEPNRWWLAASNLLIVTASVAQVRWLTPPLTKVSTWSAILGWNFSRTHRRTGWFQPRIECFPSCNPNHWVYHCILDLRHWSTWNTLCHLSCAPSAKSTKHTSPDICNASCAILRNYLHPGVALSSSTRDCLFI